jgi:hypothetical protein
MKTSALLPSGRRCRVEDAALAMLAEPGMAGLEARARQRAPRRRWSFERRDIKPAPAPTTDG